MPLIEIRDLVVDFDTGKRVVRALHGIDLALERGESLGLVGESGCGKSVTWLAALGLLGPRARVQGDVRLEGMPLLGADARQLERVRGRRIAMIFQDPTSSLNPVHRIGTQLAEALVLHRGMNDRSAWTEARRLLDRVGIANAAQRLNDYPHQLSGGMNQRVMIAMALAGEPDVLIADEPTTALDATIQAQILDLLRSLRDDGGMALVLISHDLGVVAENCQRIAVMYCGRIVETATVADLFAHPAHPYTRGLLAALPEMEGPVRRLEPIPGSVPEPWNLPPGCAFEPRCLHARGECRTSMPTPRRVAAGHSAACVRFGALVSDQAPQGTRLREVA
ncbi:ABC transporter ATP-binding protein [Reyranella sp. CPCC 100927]|uniref:ABC transporter ATP-binding protein n=1 Tax=Reyranella sp. CPCC 100927 TaxID=2599616 RepID=UPI0011B53A9F|nr:ABC transporter ATP-binding protein [Reyranella sp. CPCC 100927]TWS98268.1 ABC transporter ATP-binding protein [Reyranella sp. CPCC 100927]